MPRDPSGNYTLPAGNPVVVGTTIDAAWANTTLNDIAAEITDSLSRNGDGGMNVPLLFQDGSDSAPGMAFDTEPTTGFYRAGSGQIGVSGQTTPVAIFNGPANSVSIPGELTVSGAFTSPGIDDNASDTRLLIGSSFSSWGPSDASEYQLRRAGSNAGSLAVAGGGSTGQGASVVLYGVSHATQALDFSISAGSNSVVDWDESTGTFTISTGVGAKTPSFVLGADQRAAFGSGYTETDAAVGASDIDCATATYFNKTISGDTTFTFSNPAPSGVTSFTLELTNPGAAVITWPESVRWSNGTEPNWSSTGVDIVSFVTRDAGANWYGFLGGQGFA